MNHDFSADDVDPFTHSDNADAGAGTTGHRRGEPVPGIGDAEVDDTVGRHQLHPGLARPAVLHHIVQPFLDDSVEAQGDLRRDVLRHVAVLEVHLQIVLA